MSAAALLSLASAASSASGLPIGAAITLLHQVYQNVENVKIHRQRCRALSDRCVELILALRESSQGLEGTKTIQWLDEITATIERINGRVQEWSQLSSLKSFLQMTEIREGVDRFNRDIDSSYIKFSINMSSHLAQGSMDLMAVQERDHTEVRETLHSIVENQEAIRTLLGMKSETAIEDVMQGLQQELHDSSLAPSEEHSFRQGLWELRSETGLLPPMADLTGQVVRSSVIPAAFGAHNDVYEGVWLDKEKVALRLPRALEQTITIQKHFQKEVAIWRSLKPHPNVVPLYGLANIDGRVYSVSPWMGCGTSVEFLRNRNDATTRLRVLSELASGLEHLHVNGIVHGDLRGVNVLVCQNGVARLSDFGLSKFLEDLAQGMTSNSGTNLRWSAPELLLPSGVISTQSDIWSFGMVCLELFTDSQPFSDFPRDMTVMRELERGRLPPRPEPREYYLQRGLTDEMWSLLQMCWQYQPDKRPSMSEVKLRLSKLTQPSTSPKVASPISLHQENNGKRPRSSDSRGFRRATIDIERQPSLSGSMASYKWLSPSVVSSPQDMFGPDPLGITDAMPLYEDPAPITQSPVLIRGKSGIIACGNKEGLMYALIDSSFATTEQDLEYRTTFLSIHPIFCPSDEVLEFLVSSFHGNLTAPPDRRATLRYNVLAVLDSWLCGYRLQLNAHAIDIIREFCQAVTDNNSNAPVIRQRAERLLRLVDSDAHRTESSHSSLPLTPSRRIPQASEISPSQMAIALTIMEGDLFGKVYAADCIAHLQDPMAGGPVSRLYHLSNKISMFVKRTILRSSRVEVRAERLAFLINTAQECLKLRNFATLSTIINALRAPAISALTLTFREMKPKALRAVLDGKLTNFVSPMNNHAAYKAALPQSLSRDSGCVPWTAVHLRDLQWAFSKNAFVTGEDGTLIDFSKCSDFCHELKQVLKFTAPELNRHKDEEALVYLREQFKGIRIDQLAEDQLLERSKELAKAESELLVGRKRELGRAGF